MRSSGAAHVPPGYNGLFIQAVPPTFRLQRACHLFLCRAGPAWEMKRGGELPRLFIGFRHELCQLLSVLSVADPHTIEGSPDKVLGNQEECRSDDQGWLQSILAFHRLSQRDSEQSKQRRELNDGVHRN